MNASPGSMAATEGRRTGGATTMVAHGGMPALPRLLAALVERGHRLESRGPGRSPASSAFDRHADHVLVAGPWEERDTLLPAVDGVARVLVITCIGAHPDARSPILRRQWIVEEKARALGLPVLVLRLAPLLGPNSPLWRRLSAGGPLPRGGRLLSRPVLEADVVDAIHRAFIADAPWEGWFEACGAEVWSLSELSSLARRPRAAGARGDWEPPVEVWLEQRLPDPDPWRSAFGIGEARLSETTRAWA